MKLFHDIYAQLKSKIYYILGAFILLLIYYVLTRSLVEGFDGLDSEKYAPEVKDSHTKIMDSLNISKYRSNYEDIIKHKIKWCDSQLLAHVVSSKLDLDDPMSVKNTEHINKLNNLHKFKESLTNSLEFLDNQ
jgi:hypothetical protein